MTTDNQDQSPVNPNPASSLPQKEKRTAQIFDGKEADVNAGDPSKQKELYAEFDRKCERGEFDTVIAETERDYREGNVLHSLEEADLSRAQAETESLALNL